MCFAPQRRALFRHLKCQRWSEHQVFCTFWFANVLRATTACNFSSLIWPAGSAEPTFRPSGAPNHWKNTVFRDFLTFSRICIFFLLTLLSSNLLSSDLSLLSASALLCFSSVHIVGSLTSKLPSLMLPPRLCLLLLPSSCEEHTVNLVPHAGYIGLGFRQRRPQEWRLYCAGVCAWGAIWFGKNLWWSLECLLYGKKDTRDSVTSGWRYGKGYVADARSSRAERASCFLRRFRLRKTWKSRSASHHKTCTCISLQGDLSSVYSGFHEAVENEGLRWETQALDLWYMGDNVPFYGC